MTTYDLIIIGAGPGGYETAAEAARMGLKTAIIERDKLGGTCLNRGCIPTKALCHSAATAAEDYRAAAARKDEIIDRLREGVAFELKDVDVIDGEARFVDKNTVAVGDETFTAAKIIVATGSAPARLNIPGAEFALTSDDMLQLTERPESMVIIGGGVIGMEFASIFNSFGTRVTVLEYCREILPGIDGEIAKRLRMSLKRRGVTIVTGTEVKAIREGLSVDYVEKGKEKCIECQTVLMAVGRRAVIPEGLTDLGVALERGFISTGERMMTSVDGIYAIGDVNGRCLLAHAASAQGSVALGLQTSTGEIPAAVFTMPECAIIGLTEERCIAQGIDYAVGKATYHSNGKAVTMAQVDGLVKILIDKSSDRILGCHICGAHAADLVQEVTVAMQCGVTARQLAGVVHIHPTLSELIPAALNNARG